MPSDLENSNLEDSNLEDSNLEDLNLEDSNIEDSNLEDSNLMEEFTSEPLNENIIISQNENESSVVADGVQSSPSIDINIEGIERF